jgi:hypothetical protein
MTDPSALLQQLFAAGAIPQQTFGRDSRYYGLPLLTTTDARGDSVQYVSRRFVPRPELLSVLQRYRVRQGDRIDVIAAALIGNPLSYWQICDANLAIDPDDVTAHPGTFISITLPPGSAGT